MGLNRVSNPKKLRRLSALVVTPVIRAYSRWFDDQRTLLVFTDETTAYVVSPDGGVRPYTDEPVALTPHGVRVLGVSPSLIALG